MRPGVSSFLRSAFGCSCLAVVVISGCAQLLDVGGFTIDSEPDAGSDNARGDALAGNFGPDGAGTSLAPEAAPPATEASDRMAPCVTPLDCVETRPCRLATCESGSCGAALAPAGSDCDDGRGGRRCNDDGDCVACRVDGRKNDAETDVDCGGRDCGKCADLSACEDGADCVSNICSDAICLPATCSDGERNGDETGTDCGGSCRPCPQAVPCEVAGDCESGHCVDGVCCGVPCDGLCEQCNAETGACELIVDGQDPDDECPGLDHCNGRGTCSQCDDETVNGDETDFDCGGPICRPCAVGGACLENRDCESCRCDAGGVCAPPVCNNGEKDECESDVDCGGPCGPTCAVGRQCTRKADCLTSNCEEGRCTL